MGYIQFINDTIIYCNADVKQVENLKIALLWFELVSESNI